jgi:hypothetical protein
MSCLENNKERASFGMRAIEQVPDFREQDLATSVTDTLANIMHACLLHNVDFCACMDTACDHLVAEVNDKT